MVNSNSEFKHLCKNASSELLNYLDAKASEKLSQPLPQRDVLVADQEAFSNVLNHLYTVTSWASSYYGEYSGFNVFRDSIGRRCVKNYVQGMEQWLAQALQQPLKLRLPQILGMNCLYPLFNFLFSSTDCGIREQ